MHELVPLPTCSLELQHGTPDAIPIRMMNLTLSADVFAVIADAMNEGSRGAAIKLLLAEGATLSQALAATEPAREPRVGDILVSSWGYDQTNVDYYQVIAVTKASVRIREICTRYIASDRSSDIVAPARDAFASARGDGDSDQARREKGATKRVRPIAATVRMSRGGDGVVAASYSVRIEDFATATLWDGEANRQTGASYGH